MNKTSTSKEAILSAGKEIVVMCGVQALNMRDIAHKCGISVGSVYNYFPSKDDLMIAVIQSVWQEIIPDVKGNNPESGFVENVSTLFYHIQAGGQKYPSFFGVHAMNIADGNKNKGRDVMNHYFKCMKDGLVQALDADVKVRKGAFTEAFPKMDFVEFVFQNMLSLLMSETKSCHVLLEIIYRTIY